MLIASIGCSSEIEMQPHTLMKNPVTLLVDFEDDATLADIKETEEELGRHLVPNSVMFHGTKLMRVTVDASEADELMAKIRNDWDIEAVELSQTYETLRSEGFDVPNDPFWPQQAWHMDMIGLREAWNYSTGEGVTVAIVDTGISGEKSKYPMVPDLKQTCMVPGYNFVDDNNDPYDRNSHGTHVGSSVAESTNNNLGGVGIAYDACLMPLKVLSDSGSGYTEDIAEAIIWATNNGAQVINMSLGGGGYSQVMQNAIDHAVKNNVLVLCAAGNSGRAKIEYPAAQDGCLAIASVGPDGNLAPYSSHGEGGEGIFLASPGGNMRDFGPEGGVWQSTVDRNDPHKWGMFPYQGTSMATPIAAGSTALVVSALLEKNGDYDREDVIQILASAATDKNDNFRYGHGIVNVAEAVKDVKGSAVTFQILAAFIFAGLVAFVASRKMLRRPRM